MTVYRATYLFVNSSTLETSSVKIDFNSKLLNTDSIAIDQNENLKDTAKVFLKREQEQINSISNNNTTINKNTRDSISKPNKNIISSVDSTFTDSNKSIATSTVQVRPLGEEGNLIHKPQNEWMIGVSLFLLILMAISRFSFGKYLFRVFDSVLNYQSSNNLFLEKNMRNLRGSIFLNTLFITNISLFLVQYFNCFFSPENTEIPFTSYLYTLVGIMGLYLGKIITIRSIGYIFNGTKEAKEYLHTVFIYNKNLGIILLLITLSVPFIAEFSSALLLNVGLIIALIFYIFRLFRGIKILFRKHVSIFYMILYLCALEILPLLVIYKLLISIA
nr:DUF4271 domain-containing protein [uncultured Marinifilum sp.]